MPVAENDNVDNSNHNEEESAQDTTGQLNAASDNTETNKVPADQNNGAEPESTF